MANGWAGLQLLRYTPPRSENYTALASPKLRSPVGSGLDALQYAEFWVIPPRNRSAYIPYTGSPKGHKQASPSPVRCLQYCLGRPPNRGEAHRVDIGCGLVYVGRGDFRDRSR